MESKLSHSIVITTHNRAKELRETLQRMKQLTQGQPVEYIVYNDASTDETKQILNNFKDVRIINGIKNIGLIAARNILMQEARGEYILSLDDDSNIVNKNFMHNIENYFIENPRCAVIATRIFWGKTFPDNYTINEQITTVKSFVGCGHIWRKSAWLNIVEYPEWFQFYGEEDFASINLFINNWEVNYVPNIVVHHRVDLLARKGDKDNFRRAKLSLRSGWFLILLFYPLMSIPRIMIYTIWVKIKNRVFKGDFNALWVIFAAQWDVIVNMPKILSNRNPMTKKEFITYKKLEETKVYWKPNL